MTSEGEHPVEPGVPRPPTEAGPPSPAAPPEPAVGPAPSSSPAPPRRKRKPDPWAHRRGEPRVFAFLWTIFLFVATGLTFMTAVSLGGISADVMRPATRVLLAVTITGIVLIWPMVRLSQLADDHPVSGVAQDLVVVLIPAQAVIWPQWLGWLGRWPWSVIAAVAALFAAWALLTGGLLAIAQVFHRRADTGYARWTPWKWMAAFAALGIIGTALALASPSRPPAADDVRPPDLRSAWMLSPITATFELTRDRSWSGSSARVVPGHWIFIVGTAAASVPLWALAAALQRGLMPPARLH